MVPWRMVRWRGWNEYDHRTDLNNLCRPVGPGHVRFEKPRFGLAWRSKQDPRSEGQTREAGKKPEKGHRQTLEELSSTGEEVGLVEGDGEKCSIYFPIAFDDCRAKQLGPAPKKGTSASAPINAVTARPAPRFPGETSAF